MSKSKKTTKSKVIKNLSVPADPVNEFSSSDTSAIIGCAFKSLRRCHGLTQLEISQILGISASAYSHYECGDRIPDLINLMKISNLYSINITYLMLLSCIDAARRNSYQISDVFRAYSHGHALPEDEACIIASCNRLTPDNRENLKLFLRAAISNS